VAARGQTARFEIYRESLMAGRPALMEMRRPRGLFKEQKSVRNRAHFL